MAVDLNTIKALTFDVGGTIFDWHHTVQRHTGMSAHSSPAVHTVRLSDHTVASWQMHNQRVGITLA